MATKKIKPIDFDKAIKDVLAAYGDSVRSTVEESINTVAGEAVEKLKAVDTFAPNGNPTGEYSASWTAEKVSTGRVGIKTVVHNLKHYRLTHLLEKGHVSRNGTGRTFGRVRAYPHIGEVNDFVERELPKEVERRL